MWLSPWGTETLCISPSGVTRRFDTRCCSAVPDSHARLPPPLLPSSLQGHGRAHGATHHLPHEQPHREDGVHAHRRNPAHAGSRRVCFRQPTGACGVDGRHQSAFTGQQHVCVWGGGTLASEVFVGRALGSHAGTCRSRTNFPRFPRAPHRALISAGFLPSPGMFSPAWPWAPGWLGPMP